MPRGLIAKSWAASRERAARTHMCAWEDLRASCDPCLQTHNTHLRRRKWVRRADGTCKGPEPRKPGTWVRDSRFPSVQCLLTTGNLKASVGRWPDKATLPLWASGTRVCDVIRRRGAGTDCRNPAKLPSCLAAGCLRGKASRERGKSAHTASRLGCKPTLPQSGCPLGPFICPGPCPWPW